MKADRSSPVLASVGQRVGNGVVDLILTLPLASVVGGVTGLGTIQFHGLVVVTHLDGSGLIITIGVVFVLFALMEHWTGKTPGKHLTGTHAGSARGESLSFRASLIRNLLRFVDFFLAGLLGAAVILATERSQRVGDLLADTCVFRD